MISKRIVANVVAFLVVSIVLVTFGVFNLLGNPFAAPTRLSAIFPDASGVFPNFDVRLNGVDVGTVTSVRLARRGVRIAMSIDPGVRVPADAQASIGIANDLGEQVVDLTPVGKPTRRIMHSGAVVPVAPGGLPVQVAQVVATATHLLDAIRPGELNKLLAELATAVRGRAGDMRTIVSASAQFSAEFLHYQRQFEQLLSNAPPVLDAVSSSGRPLEQALANTQVLLNVLAAHRSDLVRLFAEGADATSLGRQLVASQGPNLACLVYDSARITANLDQPANLANLASGLANEHDFFGPVAAIAPVGPSRQLTASQPAASQVEWLRMRLLFPPQQPSSISYARPRGLPPTLPGAGCSTELGNGVGPATQPGFQPSGPGSRVEPAPASASVVRGRGSPAPPGAPGGLQTGDVRSPLPDPWSPSVPAASVVLACVGAGWSRRRHYRR